MKILALAAAMLVALLLATSAAEAFNPQPDPPKVKRTQAPKINPATKPGAGAGSEKALLPAVKPPKRR